MNVDKLPDTINQSVEKDHAGAVINKAYVREDKYKLEVTFSDEPIEIVC